MADSTPMQLVSIPDAPSFAENIPDAVPAAFLDGELVAVLEQERPDEELVENATENNFDVIPAAQGNAGMVPIPSALSVLARQFLDLKCGGMSLEGMSEPR